MRGTIHLIRHGPSAHVDRRRWYPSGQVHLHEAAYDAAGIRDDLPPSPSLIELARRADLLYSSDMRRAIDSMKVLAPGRTPIVLPSLRELSLDPPVWIPLPLPIAAWGTMSFVRWSTKLALGSGDAVMRRAEEAAGVLAEAAATSDSVAVMTHGAIRRLVTAALLRRGYAAISRDGGYANWSCWTLQSR
jgi:broad specificity phosphatase PhoE